MFNNIGGKIKGLARVFCAIGIILALVGGISNIAIGAGMRNGGERLIAFGIAILVVGVILAWVGSFLLYGFGQLVENSDIRTEIMAQQALEEQEND